VILEANVERRYTQRAELAQDNLEGRIITLRFDSRREATGFHTALGLPCFN
jgi:hypothetical protein